MRFTATQRGILLVTAMALAAVGSASAAWGGALTFSQTQITVTLQSAHPEYVYQAPWWFALGVGLTCGGIALMLASFWRPHPPSEPAETGTARSLRITAGSAPAAPIARAPRAGSAIKCLSCGATLPEDSLFCAKCGKDPRLAVCPSCRSPREADAEWCRHCGLSLPPLAPRRG